MAHTGLGGNGGTKGRPGTEGQTVAGPHPRVKGQGQRARAELVPWENHQTRGPQGRSEGNKDARSSPSTPPAAESRWLLEGGQGGAEGLSDLPPRAKWKRG